MTRDVTRSALETLGVLPTVDGYVAVSRGYTWSRSSKWDNSGLIHLPFLSCTNEKKMCDTFPLHVSLFRCRRRQSIGAHNTHPQRMITRGLTFILSSPLHVFVHATWLTLLLCTCAVCVRYGVVAVSCRGQQRREGARGGRGWLLHGREVVWDASTY